MHTMLFSNVPNITFMLEIIEYHSLNVIVIIAQEKHETIFKKQTLEEI